MLHAVSITEISKADKSNLNKIRSLEDRQYRQKHQ